ncbi:MAG: hypothetical protein GY922_06375, partial [Proteobacteria bacterium]|nr:hypothetical protein [Pseudomonadota bacterium]
DASAANHVATNLDERLALAKRDQVPRYLHGQHGDAAPDLRVRRPLHVDRHNAQREKTPAQSQQLRVKHCAWHPRPLPCAAVLCGTPTPAKA